MWGTKGRSHRWPPAPTCRGPDHRRSTAPPPGRRRMPTIRHRHGLARPGGPCMSRWCPPAADPRFTTGIGPTVRRMEGSSGRHRAGSIRRPQRRRSTADARRRHRPARGSPAFLPATELATRQGTLPGAQHTCAKRIGSGSDRTVEASSPRPRRHEVWDLSARSEDAQCDREVVVGPAFGQVRRGEVHRDRPIGESNAGGGNRCPYPVLASRTAVSGRPESLKASL